MDKRRWALRYALLILACLILVGPASAMIINLTQMHGETWIKFAWAIDATDYGTDKCLFLYLDGVPTIKTDLASTPALLVAQEYYLTDLKTNEQHGAKLILTDNSTLPPTPLDTRSLQVTTDLESTYYYVILGLVLVLLFISIVMAKNRNEVVAIVFNVGAIILSSYLAIATQDSNKAFSAVGILLSVVGGAVLLFLIYEIVEDKNTWRD